MAITHSPMRTASLSPRVAHGSVAPASIFSSAMSVRSSRPITLADSSRSSCKRTRTSAAFSTTWLLVRICPLSLMMTPVPCSRPRRRGPSSSGRRVAVTLTTAGPSCCASSTNVGTVLLLARTGLGSAGLRAGKTEAPGLVAGTALVAVDGDRPAAMVPRRAGASFAAAVSTT